MLNLLKFKNIIHSKMSFKESAFGWDGLSTFIFSNVLLLATFALGFFWLFWQTLKTAILSKKEAKTDAMSNTTVLIAGLCLADNQPTDEFKSRLNRAVALVQASPQKTIQIIILGGVTGNNQISEARAGADYLLAQGVDAEQIVIEEQSRHTLENMQNARTLLLNKRLQQFSPGIIAVESSHTNPAIISSRYHLYRVLTLARGLKMILQPIAAEEHFTLSVLSLLRLLKEAYYLHWYWSGKLWVFITANKKSRARIT